MAETQPEAPPQSAPSPPAEASPETTSAPDVPVQPAQAPLPAETPAEPAVSEEPAAPAGDPDPQLIAQGRDVFATSCFACHGADATGTPIGPDLTDGAWLNVTGAVTPASIAAVVRNGVAQPVQFPAPMPPMGGVALTDEQVRAVSAYVYSLSQ